MNKDPVFSIIIPVRTITPYLRETLLELKQQTFKSFEVLVITDKLSKNPSPGFKRNLGAQKAKGKYLAFLDDDSYPKSNWLKNIYKIFQKHKNIIAVCGPCLTPKKDNIYQQASGLVWSSFLGSGGAGVYRNSIKSQKKVDDFPTVNLIIKKEDFNKIGGFNEKFWPGEDTILCLDIIKSNKNGILYHPSVVVYHHRRAVLIPHLQQITRYALHRGFFFKKFPQNSFRLGYILPSLFVLYLLSLIVLKPNILLLLPLYLYLSILLITFINFLIHKNNFLSSLLAAIAIPLTHIYYGILFSVGLLTPNLQSKPHKVIKNSGYIGG